MVTLFDVSYGTFKSAAEFSTVYFHVNPKQDGYVLGTGNQMVVYHTRVRDASDIADFAVNIEPNAIEVTKEGDALASPTIFQTGQLQVQYDLQESDSDFIYIGKARQGVAQSAIGWTIERYAVNGNGKVTQKLRTVQDDAVWDDRLTETYS